MAISQERFSSLAADVQRSVYQDLEIAWKNNRVADYLKSIGQSDLIPQEEAPYWDDACKNGKIIIFGEKTIKERDLIATIESEHISRDRIELCIGYDKLQKYHYKNLRYNNNYRLILIGAMPHSAEGKAHFSSIISMLENTDGYAKVIRLCSNSQLKITKTSLRKVIHGEVENGYLAAA